MNDSTNALGMTKDEAIRIEAYLLSEKAGHPSGMDAIFWTQAVEIVHGRIAAFATANETKPSKPSPKKLTAKASQPKPKPQHPPKARRLS